MDSEIASRIELVLPARLPTRSAVDQLCSEAVREQYRSIAVPSGGLLLAHHFLEEATVKISCRIGFPFGAMDPDVKRYETELAIDAGAHEIELLPSLAKLEDGEYKAVLREIRDVTEAADERPLKVAIEKALLNDAALRELPRLILDSGAQYICLEDINEVHLFRELCGPNFGIAVRVRTLEGAYELMSAGASILRLER